MESGVKLLVNDIKAAVERGARVRILTGNYLNITQPAALYMLRRELGDAVSVRFYNVPNKSFIQKHTYSIMMIRVKYISVHPMFHSVH